MSDTERSVTYVYLCEECEDEKATTSTVAGPFEAPPSVFCGCTGELREMGPTRIGEGDELAISFAEENR